MVNDKWLMGNLLTAYCLPLTANYQLPTVNYQLPTINCQLSTANFFLRYSQFIYYVFKTGGVRFRDRNDVVAVF